MSVANNPERLLDFAETDRDCGAYSTLVGCAVLTHGGIFEHGLYRALDGWFPERVTEGFQFVKRIVVEAELAPG